MFFLTRLSAKPPKTGEYNGYRWELMLNGYRRYYCKTCGQLLMPGPEGCGSLNAVCVVCKTNEGCLPNFWDRP